MSYGDDALMGCIPPAGRWYRYTSRAVLHAIAGRKGALGCSATLLDTTC